MADSKLVDLALLPSPIVATDYIYVERPVGVTPLKASGDLITAATLQTARTINGMAFDGSANITVAAAAGTLTGATLAAGVTASSLVSAAGGAFGSAAFTSSAAYDPAGSAAAAQAASQPLDSDLTAIAALAPSNDDLIQRKAGAWTNRTPAQVKTDLALTSSDVGLGNVTNNAQTQAAIVPNTAPAAGEILVGNAGGTAYAKAAVSGDATLASTGALTVAADAITNAKLANAAANTVKVNATTGADNPTDLAMGASTILARLAAGNIVAATPTEIMALLGVTKKLNIVLAGGSTPLTTGVKDAYQKTFDGGTLVAWTLICKPSGSITVDVLRSANGAGLPTVSIVGAGAEPAVATGVEASGTTFTNWTSTTITSLDNVTGEVTAADGVVTYAALTLFFR